METHSDEYLGLACCVERGEDSTVLHLFGTLDVETTPAMRRVLGFARSKDDKALIVDVDGLTVSDSAEVADVLHPVCTSGLPIAVVCRPARHELLLGLTGASEQISVCTSIDEAREMLARRRRGRLFSKLTG